MRELASCLIDAEVTIGSTSYRLRVPMAREAIVLYAAIEAQDLPTLRAACRAWLPSRLFDRYFGPGSVLLATLADLGDLLRVGVPDIAQHEVDMELVKDKARRQSMFAVLADFARQQSTPAPSALEMPWPLFVGLVAENIRLAYREKADFMIAYATARSGKEDLWHDVMRQAGYGGDGNRGDFEEPRWMDDAWQQRQLDKIAAIQRRKAEA